MLVDDVSLRLIAYSPARATDDAVRKASILTRETPQTIRELHFAHGIATATEPVRTPPHPEIGLESRLCLPIRCDGALFGYLWLIDAEQAIDRRRCAIAQRCADEIGQVMHRHHARQTARRQREAHAARRAVLPGRDRARRGRARGPVKERLVAGPASACWHCDLAMTPMRRWSPTSALGSDSR